MVYILLYVGSSVFGFFDASVKGTFEGHFPHKKEIKCSRLKPV